MVARDVVEFLHRNNHTDPFQSGFDSQHRQEKSWIENVDGSIPLKLSINIFAFFFFFASLLTRILLAVFFAVISAAYLACGGSLA
jgi:hypothetical protein